MTSTKGSESPGINENQILKAETSNSFYTVDHMQPTLISSGPKSWNSPLCQCKDILLHI